MQRSSFFQKKKNKFKTRVQKSVPYLLPQWRQNGYNRYPIYDQNGWKTIPFGAAHTYIAHMREYPPGKRPSLGLSQPPENCQVTFHLTVNEATGVTESLIFELQCTVKFGKSSIHHLIIYPYGWIFARVTDRIIQFLKQVRWSRIVL